MASSSPFRSPMPSTPAPQAPPQQDSSALLGENPQEQSPSGPTSNETDANRQFVTLVRKLHDDLDTLARMRPEFGPYAKQAKKAVTDGMVKAVSSQGMAGPERQPTPQ